MQARNFKGAINYASAPNESEHRTSRRKLLGLFGAVLVVGCNEMNESGNTAPMEMTPKGRGETIASGGKQFRLFVLAGVRFMVPISHPVEAFPGDTAGMYLHLLWPDIPPGTAPGTKFTESAPDTIGNKTSNRVEVQVWQRREGHEDVDQYAVIEKQGLWSSPEYVSRDDPQLGLRLFVGKDVDSERFNAGFFYVAYSLKSDVRTPYFGLPVAIRSQFIRFVYAPDIHVRISMIGWSGRVNPDWRGIYSGVVETLDAYRENSK